MPELFTVAHEEWDFQPHICSKGLKINLPIQFFKKLHVDNCSYRLFKHWQRGYVQYEGYVQCARSTRLAAIGSLTHEQYKSVLLLPVHYFISLF